MDPGDQNQPNGGESEAPKTREQTLPVGYRLQEYVISKVVGSGGFGVTYFGRDANLDKAVAIKEYFPFSLASRYDDHWVAPHTTVQDDQSEYEWGLSRFIDEARTLAKFEHPNLVGVIRYIEENGTAYIVMDFADGRPLSRVVNEDGLMNEDSLKGILMPLLDGLSMVHAADILHRDVKPENIIIRPDGSPVLIDFGAARQAIGSRSQPISTILTPGYAPYEQYFSSGNQGPWTDIYALGAVSYACLTGDTPHEAVQRAVEDPTTPLTEAAKGRGSQQFLEALDWAIRPREADRPQTAEALKSALLGGPIGAATSGAATQRISGDAVPTPQPPPAQQPKKSGGISALQIGLIAGAVVVAAGGGYAVWDLSKPKGGFVNQQPAPSPTKPETAEKKPEEQKVVTPSPPPTPPTPQPAPRTEPTPPQPSPQPTPVRRPPIPTPPPATPSPQPQRTPAEIAADNQTFQNAEFIGTPEAYALYLRLHPNGIHAAKARRRTR